MIWAVPARATLLFAIAALQTASCVQMLVLVPDRGLKIGSNSPKPDELLPPVQPLIVRSIAPKDASAINAARPFTAPVGAPASPFNGGIGKDGDRALACLAAAVYYEAAGEGLEGERAVAQVVLNRVRHPAFPNTVCGVVFQGAGRSTGCQFTFTCDGSLLRVPSVIGWTKASLIAAEALRGRVEPAVGNATHYHATYVVPVWRTSMDKIAHVGLHIFYRWKGRWGTSGAFTQPYGKLEIGIESLASLSPSHAVAAPAVMPASMVPPVRSALSPGQQSDASSAPVSQAILVALQRGKSADSLVPAARAACARFKRCLYFGWADPTKVAASATLTAYQRDSLSFSYERDDDRLRETMQWDCHLYPDRDRRSCLSRVLLIDIERARAAGL
jgi:hypothetical protein